MSLLASAALVATMSQHSFTIGPDSFLLNGKPVVIRSGEMHMARVPREYWRHRLKMMKAMGCNAVCCYLFWNFHERTPGKFTWSGEADAAAFCKIAQEEGLLVILRPGPYSCAEWELGGMPWWLLKDETMKVRTQHPYYMERSRQYLRQVGKQLAPLQITKGGPIIMVQVENEYGSFGSDKEYIGRTRDSLVQAGFTQVPLFTCDGPSQLKNDTRDDIFSVVNFGGGPKGCFEELRKIRPTGPLMCGEFYPGWFDSWGSGHHRGNDKNTLGDLQYMLENKASFSIYMVHGGTSFGLWSGANAMPYRPQTSSYDYDAPISENGDPAPKFFKMRELFGKHLNPGEKLTPVPAEMPRQTVAPFVLSTKKSLWDGLGKADKKGALTTMEALDQGYGGIAYKATLPAGPAGLLKFEDVHDYALVKISGQIIGTMNRLNNEKSIAIPARTKPTEVTIFVEAMGRVNYGGHMHDRKGLHGPAELIVGDTSATIKQWSHYLVPFEPSRFAEAKVTARKGPGLYTGSFTVSSKADTWIDVTNLNKGVLWVNGHCLGRYWNIGPTQTMFCPGPWLKKGKNVVQALDFGDAIGQLRGLDYPILDKAINAGKQPFKKQGQAIDLGKATKVAEGELPRENARHAVRFEVVTTKRIAIEALSSYTDDNYTTLAELQILDEQGKPLPPGSARVVFADSEELGSEDGSAGNVFDGDRSTIWHTAWASESPAHPHYLVVELLKPTKITGVTLLPRGTGQNPGNGTIKKYRVYVGERLIRGPE